MSANVDTATMSSYADKMQVRTARNLGAAVKGYRLRRGWSQAELAARAKVSRQWIVGIEAGKATAEIGPVLRTLDALGLVIDLVPATVRHGTVDLDELLGGGGWLTSSSRWDRNGSGASTVPTLGAWSSPMTTPGSRIRERRRCRCLCPCAPVRTGTRLSSRTCGASSLTTSGSSHAGRVTTSARRTTCSRCSGTSAQTLPEQPATSRTKRRTQKPDDRSSDPLSTEDVEDLPAAGP